MLAAKDSMDLIFSTHWVYPARTLILQPIDEECIRNKIIRGGMYLVLKPNIKLLFRFSLCTLLLSLGNIKQILNLF